jgi:hypothetical protein
VKAGYRKIDDREVGLIRKLLDTKFPGRDDLLAQLDDLAVKQIEVDGTLRLECESGPSSISNYGPVSEGVYKDADGVDISVILHVGKTGFMNMLEILKVNCLPIINPPNAQGLVVSRSGCPGAGGPVISGKEQP